MARTSDFVSMAYRIDQLPGRRSRAGVFQVIREAVRDRAPLPPGWAVTWMWRNTPQQPMRSAPLEQVVRDSRGGFIKLMLGRLERDSGLPPLPMRGATPAEIRALETVEEDTAEQRRETNLGQATRQRRQRDRLRRRRAALKGWETRRRRQAETARVARTRARRRRERKR